jgi:hypothetical protein
MTGWASWSAMTDCWVGSQPGFRVVTTKRTATATVTVCAKISHNLFMKARINET